MTTAAEGPTPAGPTPAGPPAEGPLPEGPLAGDPLPDERRKMTVSERSLGTLAPALEAWLAGRLGHPEELAISGLRVPGNPLVLEVQTVTSVPLHVGAGYGGDPDWSHGRWMGREWSQSSVYDLTEPTVAGRIPFGVIDHLARARFGGEQGWGLFEHASIGRHDPTGFADWSSVAP